MTDDILDDLFHGCAFAAYLEVWSQTRQFPPDSEAARRLAYQFYEEALAEKNRRRPGVSQLANPPLAPSGAGVPTSSPRKRRRSRASLRSATFVG
jgi:hypothetical protein